MKKTIIALMALAGVAAADAITPITDTTSGTWTTHNTAVVAEGTVSTGFTNWTVDTATYTLKETLTYTTSDTLSFSFNATNNGTGNGIITLALIGTSNAIVIGHGNYDKVTIDGTNYTDRGGDVQVGVTNNVSSTGGYGFAYTNPTDDVTLEVSSANNWVNAMPDSGTTTTLSGDIAWDGDSFALTLYSSAIDNGTTAFNYDLGLTSLDLSKVMITLEGGGKDDSREDWKTGSVSALSISTPAVPEPTTATLSLLALAGLAARRRRK